MLRVFARGSVRGKVRRQQRHALPHPLGPCGGNTVAVARVELRDHLPFEQVVERFRFDGVPGGVVSVLLTVPQRPSHLRRVRLGPPAIQFR